MFDIDVNLTVIVLPMLWQRPKIEQQSPHSYATASHGAPSNGEKFNFLEDVFTCAQQFEYDTGRYFSPTLSGHVVSPSINMSHIHGLRQYMRTGICCVWLWRPQSIDFLPPSLIVRACVSLCAPLIQSLTVSDSRRRDLWE